MPGGQATSSQKQKASDNSCQEVLARCKGEPVGNDLNLLQRVQQPGHEVLAQAYCNQPLGLMTADSARRRMSPVPSLGLSTAASCRLTLWLRQLTVGVQQQNLAQPEGTCGSSSPGPSFCAGTHLPFSGCTRGFWS